MTPTDLPPGIVPGGRLADWRPAPPRYVVCDVDGTLVGPTAEASSTVAEAVAAAQRAGIRVGFATGRMRRAVEPLWRQIEAAGPHVLHNGAEVRADGVTIASWTLTSDQVDALLTAARAEAGAYLEVYTDDAYLVSAMDERARPHWRVLGAPPDGVIAEAGDLAGRPVLKATFAAFDPDLVPGLVAAVEAAGLAAGPAGSPLTPDIRYVNATDRQADKGRAVAVATEHLGVTLAEVAAVGDAMNDLSMLVVVGTAVAMGQAPEEVRTAAHLVVPGVDEDGVAVALDALVAWAERAGA